MIGYMIEQEIGNILGYDVPLATLLTRVRVDPRDPEFQNPSKFVGPSYGKSEARRLERMKGWTVKQDGSGRRRVLPITGLVRGESGTVIEPDRPSADA